MTRLVLAIAGLLAVSAAGADAQGAVGKQPLESWPEVKVLSKVEKSTDYRTKSDDFTLSADAAGSASMLIGDRPSTGMSPNMKLPNILFNLSDAGPTPNKYHRFLLPYAKLKDGKTYYYVITVNAPQHRPTQVTGDFVGSQPKTY